MADTHLGFDLPMRPKIERRRRGEDFFSSYRRALEIARDERVDCVIHGGDLFHRSRVPQNVVIRAFEPLIELADQGMPIFIVPGNHERSVIPESLFALHESITIFHRPGAIISEIGALSIEFVGFPSVRDDIMGRFGSIIESIESSHYFAPRENIPDARFLLMHQTVEGSRVGVSDYTFRSGNDVIPGNEIPGNFDFVLSGHIHRYQELLTSLDGDPLSTPVLYPGSIERTSFDERLEEKGVIIITIEVDEGGVDASHRFVPLETRPMISIDLVEEDLNSGLEDAVRRVIEDSPRDSVVRVRVPLLSDRMNLSAARLREISPREMNITISVRPRRRGRA